MRRAVSWHLTRDTHAGRNNHTARLVVHVQHLGRLAIHRSRSNQNLVVCRIVNQGIGVLHRIVIRAKLSSNALFEISLRLAGIKFSLCVKRQNLKPTCLVNQFAIFHVNQIISNANVSDDSKPSHHPRTTKSTYAVSNPHDWFPCHHCE